MALEDEQKSRAEKFPEKVSLLLGNIFKAV